MKSFFVKKSKNPKKEFSIHKKLYSIFPSMITRPIKLKKKYIYLKMYKNKSLKHFMTTNKFDVSKLVKKVTKMIKEIQRKLPLFRHNDLHIGNIIVDDRKNLRFTDFEFSSGSGKVLKSFGITNRYNPRYDLHCFLNSLRSFLLKRRLPLDVVHRYLPVGYRGKTDKYVKNFRLRF
jgi:tRNA A-37 threonylcarbamoyl transferase component Bud32